MNLNFETKLLKHFTQRHCVNSIHEFQFKLPQSNQFPGFFLHLALGNRMFLSAQKNITHKKKFPGIVFIDFACSPLRTKRDEKKEICRCVSCNKQRQVCKQTKNKSEIKLNFAQRMIWEKLFSCPPTLPPTSTCVYCWLTLVVYHLM